MNTPNSEIDKAKDEARAALFFLLKAVNKLKTIDPTTLPQLQDAVNVVFDEKVAPLLFPHPSKSASVYSYNLDVHQAIADSPIIQDAYKFNPLVYQALSLLQEQSPLYNDLDILINLIEGLVNENKHLTDTITNSSYAPSFNVLEWLKQPTSPPQEDQSV